MIRRSVAAALLPAVLLVPTAAMGAGTAYSGSHADTRGDAPSHGDVFRASASYTPSGGHLNAKVVLASYSDAAARRTVVGGFFARLRHGRCDTSSGAALTLETDTKVAAAAVASRGHASTVPAKAAVSGNTIRLSVHGSQFKGKRWNCVVVKSLAPTGPITSKELDTVVVRLRPER